MTDETRRQIEEGIRDWSNTESEVRKRLEAAQEKWNKALQPLEDAITNSDYAHVPFKIVGTRRIRYRYIGPLRPRKISLEDDDRMTESIEWVYDHLICEDASRIRQKLESIQPNWDSYGAAAPSVAAIANAMRFLRQCSSEPTRVRPTAIGGVFVKFAINGRRRTATLEFRNDGSVWLLLSDKVSEPIISQVMVDEAGIDGAIRRIREYCDYDPPPRPQGDDGAGGHT